MNLTQEQNQIITTNNKTMLVSASAGSGKTFVVVEKIINSIVNENINIDSMLIVTFTNAAASELKERIVARLQTELNKAYEQKDKELVLHLSKQIGKVWNSNISTIHSFCLSVIKDNFYILGIDPNVTTLDATNANIMLMESIQEVIDDEYDKSDEAFYDALEILGGEDKLLAFTLNLYNYYAKVINKEEFEKKVIETYSLNKDKCDLSNIEIGKKIIYDIKSNLNLCKLETLRVINTISGIDEFNKHRQIFEMLKDRIDNVLGKSSYDDIYNLLPTIVDLPSMPRYSGQDIETKDNILKVKTSIVSNIKALSKIAYKSTEGIIEELNSMKYLLEWIFSYIKEIKQNYTEKKRKKGVIDFADYEELAVLALQDEQVAKKYREKFEYIYIDEYQDTSYIQEEIISKFARDNNVIMVGDVKQSIYGFRNAAPELFSSKYESFSESGNIDDLNIRIVLAQNFRSRKQVLDSINDIFEKIMTLEFGGARYTNKETLKYGELYDINLDNEDMHKTEINLVQYDKSELEEAVELESEIEVESIHVAKRIDELIKNYKVYDIKKKTYRNCEYKDIVILLQVATNVADKVAETLKTYGIPAYSNSKTSFYQSDEILLIISFLKILDNSFDDISLASVMYSPIRKIYIR